MKKLFFFIFISSMTFSKELVSKKGTYETIPLEKNEIILSIIQSRPFKITDKKKAKSIIKKNINHMIDMTNKACATNKPDIILFHEFPLTNFFFGNREDKKLISIKIPGEETKILSEAAKNCDAYLIFGAYAIDDDWPGHILSINTVIGRNGDIIKKIWKIRNIKRHFPTFEITTTTIESVRDKFRKKYGIDNEFPIIRTEFGNLAVSTVQLDQFVYSSFAMKGAEILLRNSTLFYQSDVIYTSITNNVFSAMANIPYSKNDDTSGLKNVTWGKSMIVSPEGNILGQLSKENEGILKVKIPIAKFRRNRTIPHYSLDVTNDITKEYVQEIPLNHFAVPKEKLPANGIEMKSFFDTISNWK